jgi:hypothetical protein
MNLFYFILKLFYVQSDLIEKIIDFTLERDFVCVFNWNIIEKKNTLLVESKKAKNVVLQLEKKRKFKLIKMLHLLNKLKAI